MIKIDKRTFKIAKHYKIPLTTIKQQCTWKEGKLYYGNLNNTDLLHEIAHYLLCPKYYLHLDDFGLGKGPKSLALYGHYNDDNLRKASGYFEDDDDEENHAFILGLAFEHFLKINNKLRARFDGGYIDSLLSATWLFEKKWSENEFHYKRIVYDHGKEDSQYYFNRLRKRKLLYYYIPTACIDLGWISKSEARKSKDFLDINYINQIYYA